MLRSILVALDETAASQAAQRWAIGLARAMDCEITGLAVLDRDHLAGPTAVGIWGMAYKEHRDQVKLAQAKQFLRHLEQGFEQSCEDLSNVWRIIEAEGLPQDLIAQEAPRHDLVVLGRDTDFHQDEQPEIAELIHRLLRQTPRPLVICSEQVPDDGPVLVATDGSDGAARASHMLALLDLAAARPVHVLSVASDPMVAEQQARQASALLIKHRLDVTIHGIGSEAAPAGVIVEQAGKLGAALIVIGSSGRPAWQELLLGSTTADLLEACPCPVFVYQ